MIEKSNTTPQISDALSRGPACQPATLSRLRRSNLPAHAGAIRVGFQTGGADAVSRKLLIAIFGIACYSDRANHFAAVVADQHAATFRKNLLAARGHEVAHEDRPLLSPLADLNRIIDDPSSFLKAFTLQPGSTTITLRGRQLSAAPRSMIASMMPSA
jgi:hypothetical protein